VRRWIWAALVLSAGSALQPTLAAQATPALPAAGEARPDRVLPDRILPDRIVPDRILIVPFANVKRDASIFWLGEASAILLTDSLNALGVGAITRPERTQAFARLQVPSSAVLTDATVIRIAQLVGAAHVILGSLQMDGDGLVVRARRLALDAGRVEADVTERGPVADLFAIFTRVADRLAQSAVRGTRPVQAAEPERPPIAAFEAYIKGLLAETPATAIPYLNSALTRYPMYDRARLALWDVYAEQGEHPRALAAVQAVPSRSTWARRARFLGGLSQLALQKNDDAFATFKMLSDEDSTPTVLNNLGVVQLRRGGNPQSGAATYYFDQAAKADPDDPDYFFNLGYAYFEGKDNPAALYWLREAVRRDPADGDAHYVLGAALAATGNAAESAREKELARRLDSTYEEWQKRPLAEQVPKNLERVKTNEIELPHARRVETRIAETSQRDQQELATFYLDRARRLFAQESDREASAELDRALYLSPYLAEAHLLLGRLHLRNGRVRDAIDALKISLWSAETAEAHAALADAYRQAKTFDDARAEAARALALDPNSNEARRVLDMLKSP
jgi:tetratricopeptide (TPR) repeat protein